MKNLVDQGTHEIDELEFCGFPLQISGIFVRGRIMIFTYSSLHILFKEEDIPAPNYVCSSSLTLNITFSSILPLS